MRPHFPRRPAFLALLAAVATGAALATVAVADATRAAPSLGDPVAFLRGVVREIAANDYADAWLTLAPDQQRLVPQSEYVHCESASPIPGHLDWIRPVRVFSEPVSVPGSSGSPTRATAVTFRIRISDSSLHEAVVVEHTVHALPVGGRWAWMLPADRLALHRSGRCLAPDGYDPGAPTGRGRS